MYKSILKITIFVCQNPKLIAAHSVTVVRAQTVRNTFTSGKTWVKNVLLLLHERVRVFFFYYLKGYGVKITQNIVKKKKKN